MERILINNKTYSGDLIYVGRKNEIEITLYVLNATLDKYLIIYKKGMLSKDFILTGLDKAYEVIELMKNDKINESGLNSKVRKDFEELKAKCNVKKLKKFNYDKFQELAVNYYDSHYPVFIILGMDLSNMINKIKKEAAC